MTLDAPVLMFAADHRWQLEQWCDAHGVDRSRIGEVKAVALEAFLRARDRSSLVARHGALLLDEQYASAQVAAAGAAGVCVGTPAEWPGAFPLRWAAEPMARALTGAFVKVLVRHRADFDTGVVEQQLAMLGTLADWCRAHDRPLVLEVLVPRASEPEDHFETVGRAPIVVDFVGRAYERGIVPAYWKLEGTTDAGAARLVDAAVAERPGARVLVLGKGAGLGLVRRWFEVARGMRTAGGFAIGRTIYMDAVARWLTGTIPREAAVDAIATTYLQVVEAWNA